jgi:hypothetical protein
MLKGLHGQDSVLDSTALDGGYLIVVTLARPHSNMPPWQRFSLDHANTLLKNTHARLLSLLKH